jgi:hypothetical protein
MSTGRDPGPHEFVAAEVTGYPFMRAAAAGVGATP